MAALSGALAIAFVLIPVIGDLIAALPALIALVLGVVGVTRHEAGRSSRVAWSAVGALLGAVALGIIGVIAAAGLMT